MGVGVDVMGRQMEGVGCSCPMVPVLTVKWKVSPSTDERSGNEGGYLEEHQENRRKYILPSCAMNARFSWR